MYFNIFVSPHQTKASHKSHCTYMIPGVNEIQFRRKNTSFRDIEFERPNLIIFVPKNNTCFTMAQKNVYHMKRA